MIVSFVPFFILWQQNLFYRFLNSCLMFCVMPLSRNVCICWIFLAQTIVLLLLYFCRYFGIEKCELPGQS